MGQECFDMSGKVIVVEDDAAFCYAVGKALEQAGFDVQTHVGSTEAWPSVGATAKIDLLVTDLLFPKGQPSGVALARSALYHHPGLPIIYMTAFEQAAEQATTEDGLVLTKPIELATLVQKVGELLDAGARKRG
jgi:DNA-binding NtrC family response regulator